MKAITKVLFVTICALLPICMVGCSTQQTETIQDNIVSSDPLDNLNMPYFAETESKPVSTENLSYDIQKGHYLVGTEQSNTTEVYYPQIDSVSALPEDTEQEVIMERINSDILKTVLLREGSTNFLQSKMLLLLQHQGKAKERQK